MPEASAITPRNRADLSCLTRTALERRSLGLLDAIRVIDGRLHTDAMPLKQAHAEIEAELVRRLIEDGRKYEGKYIRHGNHLLLLGAEG